MINNINNENWFQKPNKKNVIYFSILALLGLTLCFLAMTNLFTETPFKAQYFMMWFIIASATFSVGKLIHNYFKNK